MTRQLKRTRHPGIFEAGARYVVRYRDGSGRQRQRSCRTLEEAKRFRAKVTLNPATATPRSGPTVAEYAEEWLGALVGLRPGTAMEYRQCRSSRRSDGATSTSAMSHRWPSGGGIDDGTASRTQRLSEARAPSRCHRNSLESLRRTD